MAEGEVEISPEASQITLGDKTREVAQKIKSGDTREKEGVMLFKEFKNALDDPEKPEAIPHVSRTFQVAKESREKLGEPGEANKLVASLDALHKQAGEEGYKPEVRVEADLSDEEKNRLIEEKIGQDFDNVADFLAERYIEEYAEAKAEFLITEEKTQEVLGKETLSRAEIRRAAYQLERARKGLLRQVEVSARRIGNPEVGEKVTESLKESWKPVSAEFVSFNQLKGERREELVGRSTEGYHGQLESSKDKYADLFKEISEEKKRELFTPIAKIDHNIKYLRGELTNSLNFAPVELCGLASKIKELQMERRLRVADVRVDLARERLERARVGFPEARGELGIKLVEESGTAKEAGRNLISSIKEFIDSSVGVEAEKAKRHLTPALERISEVKEQALEGVTESLNIVDGAFLEQIRGVVSSSRETINEAKENIRNTIAKITAKKERGRIETVERYYKKAHAIELGFLGNMEKIFSGFRELKVKTPTVLGEVVGGKRVRERAEERRKEIEELLSTDLKKRIEEIQGRENPSLKIFQEDLRRRVKLIEEAAEAIREGGEEVPPKPEGLPEEIPLIREVPSEEEPLAEEEVTVEKEEEEKIGEDEDALWEEVRRARDRKEDAEFELKLARDERDRAEKQRLFDIAEKELKRALREYEAGETV
jgi:hypothetical protein